jgi:formylglycine-generating enzyme required for sulfatase activity
MESPLQARVAYVAAALVVFGLGVVTVLRADATRPHADAVTAAAAPASAAPSPAAPASPCPARMVAVGEATFRTGVPGDVDDPARNVALRAFCMDRDAITTAEYKECSDRGDCKRASRTNEWDGIAASDHEALDPLCTARDPVGLGSRPVNCVTWEMASTYCADHGARLPTEAEWAIASRTTAATVAEWVADWHGPITAPAAGEPQVDPHGPTDGEERVVRGAHAAAAPSSRFGAAPTTRSHAIGFRCARSL